MNVLTGELTVDVKDEEYATTTPMFYLTLEHFRHLVRARDYLTESECHAMMVWTSNQLSYGRTLKVVERSLKKMFDMLDADMGLNLSDVIDSKGITVIQHQLDILARSKPDDRDIFRLSAVEQEKERRKRQENDKRPPLPLKMPNDSCCWYWANGLTCNKKWFVNGKCKFEDKHGTCGMPLPAGGFCLEKHKATEH